MRQIPAAWAHPVKIGKESYLREQFQRLHTDKREDMLAHIKRYGNQTAYSAHLQTNPLIDDQYMFIEYWESDLSFANIFDRIEKGEDEFVQWCVDLKSEVTDDAIGNMKGFRMTTDFSIPGEDGVVYKPICNVLKLLPGVLGDRAEYHDRLMRLPHKEIETYLKAMGARTIREWVEEYGDDHYSIMYLEVDQSRLQSDGYFLSPEKYQELLKVSEFARIEHEMVKHFYGLDYAETIPNFKSECILEFKAK